MVNMRKQKSLFEETHHFRSKQAAKMAKANIIGNSGMLYYNIGEALRKYLDRLKKISLTSYHAQLPQVKKSMINYYKNAQSLIEEKIRLCK